MTATTKEPFSEISCGGRS